MICDVSTGCEIMPQSLAYMAEIAVLGPSWNRDTDMKRYCFLLPNITAEQIMLDKLGNFNRSLIKCQKSYKLLQ